MKRFLVLSVLLGGVVLVVMLLGSTASANTLPEVQFLGEGPGSFNTTLDDFIVKRGEEQYDFEAGPTYEAAPGERVWAVRGTKEAPEYIFNGVVDLGWGYEGCTVNYVGIDDDVNGIRNGFFIGPNLVELVKEGMVFEGSYDVPTTVRDHRFVAEEGVAGWYTPCEEPESTATPTSTTEPEETPSPGDDVIVFLAAIFDTGDEPPPPTETPIPPTETPTATVEPTTYTLVCDPYFDIKIVDEEAHFQFSATAFENGVPLENVELKGTLDTGLQNPTPSNIETTNFDGVADFFITVLWISIDRAPVSTVVFNDQETYGNASCENDFSTEPPTPTPTPPPPEFDLVCDPEYDIRVNDEDVEFYFSATAFYNGYPLPDVDLEAELDTGGITQDATEETNFNGVADFKIEVLLTNISQTPIATITFGDQAEYGNAFCRIDFSESTLLNSVIHRTE